MFIPVWKYAKNKEVTVEEIDKVLASIVCFNAARNFTPTNAPFSKLRAELQDLKQSLIEDIG